jgi:hypothetical protein
VKDLVSRFTFDSSTEFLFRNNIYSLSAGLPYPVHPSPLARANTLTFENHPSNPLFKAVLECQKAASRRTLYGPFWPLKEITGDAVTPLRKVADRFVEPFIQERMRRKKENEKGSTKASDNETLLDYLVEQTPGKPRPIFYSANFDVGHLDLEMITDEVCIID